MAAVEATYESPTTKYYITKTATHENCVADLHYYFSAVLLLYASTSSLERMYNSSQARCADISSFIAFSVASNKVRYICL